MKRYHLEYYSERTDKWTIYDNRSYRTLTAAVAARDKVRSGRADSMRIVETSVVQVKRVPKRK